ncbi:MAG: hypothetical protein MJZ06_00225 [Bacteroidaceae bacterium]|nr:hypothetical protein [Bacteroidaceae bacterium]
MKLLPHRWQINGALMFAIFVTLALLSDTSHIARQTHMNGNALYDTQSTIRLLLEHFLIPLSGIIMAMSKERREDEMISVMRRRSLLLAVAIWIMAGILKIPFSILAINTSHTTEPLVFKLFRYYEIGMFPFLYILCLKLSLWIQNRKLSKPDAVETCSLSAAKSILLPHKWQKIGLALFVAGLVMYMCSMFLAKQSFVFVLISTLVTPAGLTVAALSKEKADDERIDCIRFNALFKSVILFFMLNLLFFIIRYITVRIMEIQCYQAILKVCTFLTSWTSFMIYYILIFKISLHKENKALGNEE